MKKGEFSEVPEEGFFCSPDGKKLFRRFTNYNAPDITAGASRFPAYSFMDVKCTFHSPSDEVGRPDKKELRELLEAFTKSSCNSHV